MEPSTAATGRPLRAALLRLATAAVALAGMLHFVFVLTHPADRALAGLYMVIGVGQLGLAAAMARGVPLAPTAVLVVNSGLIALFLVSRVAGPALGMTLEEIGPVTVARKSLELLSVILVASASAWRIGRPRRSVSGEGRRRASRRRDGRRS
jgi:hypothetical protein